VFVAVNGHSHKNAMVAAENEPRIKVEDSKFPVKIHAWKTCSWKKDSIMQSQEYVQSLCLKDDGYKIISCKTLMIIMLTLYGE